MGRKSARQVLALVGLSVALTALPVPSLASATSESEGVGSTQAPPKSGAYPSPDDPVPPSPIVPGPNSVMPPVMKGTYKGPVIPPPLTEAQRDSVSKIGNRNRRGELTSGATSSQEPATEDTGEPSPSAPMSPLATPSTTGYMADPDTVGLGAANGYATYGTNDVAPGCPVSGFKHVPMILHGIGETLDLGGTCPDYDAMPDGPGAWAYQGPCAQMWAPTVILDGSWTLYYTASRANSGAGCNPGQFGQMCIGKATSDSPFGFKDAGEFACPENGQWAIDPDAFFNENGTRFVVYRDDAVTSFPQTGISVVPTYADGSAIWPYRVTLTTSSNVSWDTISNTSTTHVIENPSMIKVATNNTWYLFFSGNNWDSVRYSTGIGNCGGTTSPAGGCPIAVSTSRPYFGYVGSGDLDPLKSLPDNRPGPGGMSVFRTNGGAARAVWHWWYGGRWSMAGVLAYTTGPGFSIG